MIEFEQVTKKFGKVVALEEISFKIDSGEFVFVIGSSGSGKTTLLRLLLREYLPSSGQIKIDDQLVNNLKPQEVVALRRKIGVVFQDFKLLWNRTVRENVEMSLRILKKTETEIDEKVTEVLKLVGLEDRADFFPSQLAGGELQRVCLARAVAGEPEIIIADEPTGNLDPETAWQIVKLLKKINEDGKTVLMMTHNFEVVDSMKQRVIQLAKGKIVSDKKKGGYQRK